jgi:Terminase-like family.
MPVRDSGRIERGNNKSRSPAVIWHPQPGPQKALIDCPLPEVFFGGARGGGKTDGVLGKWALKEQRYGMHFNAVMFRRTTVSSEDAIERSKQIYRPLGAVFNEGRKTWRMPHGGKISFAYLDSIDDAQEYQGRNLTDAWIEEAGQYPTPEPIDRLFAVLRSAHGVPVQMILTGNPGGAGQHWISERYQLLPFPRKPKIVFRRLGDGARHKMAVIPSRISDNRLLLNADPGYVSRLRLVGSKELVQAWLEGDWSAVEGAFFDEWSESRHVLSPFAVPQEWLRFRSGDWGSARPFSFGWWAIASDDFLVPDTKRIIPRGAMVRYREWYGALRPNVGLKLTAEEVARGILSRETNDEIAYGVLDPACFASDGGPSIAERMADIGAFFDRADNTRVSRRGALGGWDLVRARLRGNGDGRPMLYVFRTCRDFLRTVPVLQHDPGRAEDLDTQAEDHIADETRYACASHPWIAESHKHGKVAQPPDIGRWRSEDEFSWRL